MEAILAFSSHVKSATEKSFFNHREGQTYLASALSRVGIMNRHRMRRLSGVFHFPGSCILGISEDDVAGNPHPDLCQ